VVEYTINCIGPDFDPTTDPDIDSGPILDQDVTISGALEVLDTASGGVTTQDFGPDLDEVYVWQGFMDIPADHACTVQLRARDGDGEVICSATEYFTIGADDTVKVNVLMYCGVPYQAPVGMLDLDGDFSFNIANYCPDLFVLNCVDPDLEELLVVPGLGAFVYSGCQVRFRDADSSCGGPGGTESGSPSACDPQVCVTTPSGLDCAPNPADVDPIVTTTVVCASDAPGFFCAIPGALFGTPCIPTAGDLCFDLSAGQACAPGSLMNCGGATADPFCEFTGDTLGVIGDAPPAPLATGPGGFLVGCTVADDDGDPLTPPAPLTPGATVTCTATTTDGDADCNKSKDVTVSCPGLTACQAFGGNPACQAASSTACQAGTCNGATCDGATAAACCDYVAAADGIDCSSEIPEPTGECQAGVCTPTSCLDDAACDTDGNDCTWAPPGTCDLGSNLCGPLANQPSGFSCNGDTGTCDGGGICVDNCTGVDCSDGNQCTQDLCDPSGGAATCSNPNEIDGTACVWGGPGSGMCQSGTCFGPGGELAARIETYNLALAGAFIPYEQERRVALPQAIATAQSDILCLQEVWDETDKDAIRAAALANFPYIVWLLDDLDTPLDDATDQNGVVPPPYTTVPCPDSVEVQPGITIADQMDAAIDCVRDGQDLSGNFCSTIPGSDLGRTTSIDCAIEACLLDVGDLLFGTPQQQRCYACLATQLPTDTFGTIRGRCPTVINQDLAFQGQNGVMILSRYPLSNAVNWVIPGTWNRRVILSATAELPNGSDLDVFCNHLTPIFAGASAGFPYTGQYGDGLPDAAGWEAEQFLQAEKLIAHVQNVSGAIPAVILGDLNAGRAYIVDVNDPDTWIFGEGTPTLDLLEGTFTPAYTPSYTPLCTFCQENPVAGVERTETVWIDHIQMYNLPAAAVTATERTFDQAVLPVPDGNGGTMNIPLSDHYGMRSVIVVP
jgi:hypothetical protein